MVQCYFCSRECTLYTINTFLEDYMEKNFWQQGMHKALGTLAIPFCTALCTTAMLGISDDALAAKADEQKKKPNILVIFGDDIGITNISAYSQGLMGYKTPNIDKLAKEGTLFTDYYAEQSSTAGRSAFITGQTPFRTGLSKVGMPGSTLGIQPEDVTIAEVLKAQGYKTIQLGKNHLGDRDEFLPTNHGFDEFYGNLYHLNAEEDPEHPDYPLDPRFKKMFGPRGVIHSFAGGKIIDTGPLTRKRMETIDDDIAARAVEYIGKQKKSDQPFFMWLNFTHMHFRTHTKPESVGQSGRFMSQYTDTMIDHDKNVGSVLDKLAEMGLDENTIVIYTTDNGPHMNSWPDAAMTPFRGEKNTNWEGAFRAPAIIRWPGHIPADTVDNSIVSALDWFPTLIAATGDTNIKEELLKGRKIGDKTYKVHLDGHNLLPYLTQQEKVNPRRGFLYFNDDGDLVALRAGNFKFVFMEQRLAGTMGVWAEPFVALRLPKLFNLRTDPYERADITSNTYYDWLIDHQFAFFLGQEAAARHLKTYVAFPPRQKAASFSIDQAVDKLKQTIAR